VYQEGDGRIVPFLDKMIDRLALPGSGLDGRENLDALVAKAEAGASCILFVEHYSNLDLSLVHKFARDAGGRGPDAAKMLVAIAGMKLNEENPVVAAFASAYSRIVICPSRSLKELRPEDEAQRAEIMRDKAINLAATKKLLEVKRQKKIVLCFPSGTRYRPWDPQTKRGVREIDSYIKIFDWFCPVALNGEVLHVRQGDMMDDSVSRDLVRVTVGPMRNSRDFRGAVRASLASKAAADPDFDLKQPVVDALMAELDTLHAGAEEKRQALLKKA
jgi:glycerol-3-phosphate O-acyltransferase